MPDNNSGQLAATWQGLAAIPQLLSEVKTAVYTLKTLISTPAAAVSTGSWAASGAIVLLGAEMAIFLAQTVQAIEDDVDAIRKVGRNYQETENQITAEANRGSATVDRVQQPTCPHLGPGGDGRMHPQPVRPSNPRPAPQQPTSPSAVDPVRRQQLIDAGNIAIGGLVDVVGSTFATVPPPSTRRDR